MISLPVEFTDTKYDGYFWNTKDKHVYSIKSGVLRKIKKIKVNQSNIQYYNYLRVTETYLFIVSVDGYRRYLTQHYLESLPLRDKEIKVI